MFIPLDMKDLLHNFSDEGRHQHDAVSTIIVVVVWILRVDGKPKLTYATIA